MKYLLALLLGAPRVVILLWAIAAQVSDKPECR